MENYIPEDLWSHLFQDSEVWNGTVTSPGSPGTILNGGESKLGQFADFAQGLSKYPVQPKDQKLSPRNCKSDYYDGKKVSIAKSLRTEWKKEHMHLHGLDKEMEKLIALIRTANGMTDTRA